MDLLPFEKSVRLGFIKQFRLMIENSAKALIAYVEDIRLILCKCKDLLIVTSALTFIQDENQRRVTLRVYEL